MRDGGRLSTGPSGQPSLALKRKKGGPVGFTEREAALAIGHLQGDRVRLSAGRWPSGIAAMSVAASPGTPSIATPRREARRTPSTARMRA